MDCEQANNLISAKIDGEIQPDEQAALESHLATCSACRQTLAIVSAQDADLDRAFSSRRDDVAGVVDAAIKRIHREQYRPRHFLWLTILVSAAAGFALAFLVIQPWHTNFPTPIIATTQPATPSIGHLALATGAIEVLPAGTDNWQVMATGAAVQPNSRVRTGEGVRCEFVMADGSTVRLNGRSELLLAAPRSLDLARGQMWSSVNPADIPFVVAVAQATITGTVGQFDIITQPRQTTVTVVAGNTTVAGKNRAAQVDAGERINIVDGAPGKPSRTYDLLRTTSWVNELLMLKGRDNVELHKRVDDLLAHLGEAKMGELYDEEIRFLGDHCVMPLTRYIQSPRSRAPGQSENLARAARILADLAQTWSIPDLIRMVPDPDATVRYNAVIALERLTKFNQGFGAEDCRRDFGTANKAYEAWQRWWGNNKDHYTRGQK